MALTLIVSALTMEIFWSRPTVGVGAIVQLGGKMKSSFYCALVGVILLFVSLLHASPALQFEQTDPRTYLIKNESTVLQLKVISSTSFRLQTWPETKFPEYVIVTPDGSRPLVASTAITSTGSIVVTNDKMTDLVRERECRHYFRFRQGPHWRVG